MRGLAVMAVMVYHARPDWLPGGFLGVDVFFAISGFIITRTLVSDWRARGAIDVRRFYLRRARRLLPALALVVGAVLTYALIAHPGEVSRLRLDALAAFGQVANWRFVLAHQSYFDSFARPSALRHLWSLAVEEQFYIFWPLLLSLGLRFLPPNRLALVVVAGAVASVTLMVWLHTQGAGAARLYYGTDTRAAGLLLGAALALLWSPRLKERGSFLRAAAFELLAYCALVAIGVCVFVLDQSQTFLYRGGFAIVALASAALIFATSSRSGLFTRLLGIRPLRWLGQRSYGIYLWHWPLALLTWPYLPSLPETLAGMGAAVAVATVSFQLVERPVRDGALARLMPAYSSGEPAWGWRRFAPLLAASGLAGAAIALAVLVIGARAPETSPYLAAGSVRLISDSSTSQAYENPAYEPQTESLLAAPVEPEPEPEQAFAPARESEVPATTSTAVSFAGPASVVTAAAANAVPLVLPPPPPQVFLPAEGSPMVTAIGDSVMLGAVSQLVARVPRVDIDAAIGRQAAVVAAMLWDRLQEGTLGDVVLVSIGNNGTFTSAEFDLIMAVAGPSRRVVFVNNKVPRRWEETNNAVIADGVSRHPNAALVDWHAVADARPDFFSDDFVHLRTEGAKAFANLVAAAVAR